MMRLIPLALLLAAGCVAPAEGGEESHAPKQKEDPVPVSNPNPVLKENSCDPAAAQALIGGTRSSETEAEALKLTGARKARWIKPGDAVTMDYSPTRLNISLDAQERITGFRCG